MENFWKSLEAMAGILNGRGSNPGLTVEHLQDELRQMPQVERDTMAGHLNVVSRGLSNLATMASQDFPGMQERP